MQVSGPIRGLLLGTVSLVLCFSVPLIRLVRFAAASGLYSHIILIPFISLYLVWQKRRSLQPGSPPPRRWATVFLIAGLVPLAGVWIPALSGTLLAPQDALALATLSFLLLFGAICCLSLGRETLRSLAFPLGLLLFMVPFPAGLQTLLEAILQHGSAAAAYGFFRMAGTPVFNHDLVFELPGFNNIRVAHECSGIHSSLALFITSLLAGDWFLRSPWRRTILAAAVLPLAILRNGVRIFTIGELCVHVGPEMIDSPIHRRGGPLFFVLSLVPFLLLLIYLMRQERPRCAAGKADGANQAR